MSRSILYSLIHRRSEDTWKERNLWPIDKETWDAYVKHWLASAEALRLEFKAQGLHKTADAIQEILAVQYVLLKRGEEK